MLTKFQNILKWLKDNFISRILSSLVQHGDAVIRDKKGRTYTISVTRYARVKRTSVGIIIDDSQSEERK